MPPAAEAVAPKVFIELTFKAVQHVDNTHQASGFKR